MATKTTKARKANVPVPGSIGEASEQLARIGELRRDIEARKHTAVPAAAVQHGEGRGFVRP